MAAKQLYVNLTFAANTKAVEQNLQTLKTSLSQISTMPMDVGGKLNSGLVTAANSASKLQSHLAAAMNTKTGNLDLSKLSHSLQTSNDKLSTLSTNLLNAGRSGEQAFLSLHSAINQANIDLNSGNTLLGKFAATLKNTIRWQISASLIQGFINGVTSAIDYAKDLDESLHNIRMVTHKSNNEMAAFAKSANEAAKALNTTTTAYTDAALIYYQQGLDGKAVLDRADTTVKLANVTGKSAQEVSEWMTAVWNNFADGAENLEYYADAMAALGAATASSADEIATGLEKFSGVADTVGLSYEYAASAVATVAAQTRESADVVGTAFKSIFARMQDLKLGETLDDGTTLGQYSQALAKVGVNIKTVTGDLKPMNQILDELGATWQTLGTDQQVALAKSVAGLRQYNTFMALMSNYDTFEQNVETAKESSGELQVQAEIYAQSWEGASKRVKASAESVYSALVPTDAIVDATNGFADILDGVANTIEAFGGLKTILLLITNVMLNKFGPAIANSIDNGIMRVSNLLGQLKSGEMSIRKFVSGFKPIAEMKANALNFSSPKGKSVEDIQASTDKRAAVQDGVELKRTGLQQDHKDSLDEAAARASEPGAKFSTEFKETVKVQQQAEEYSVRLNNLASKMTETQREQLKLQIAAYETTGKQLAQEKQMRDELQLEMENLKTMVALEQEYSNFQQQSNGRFHAEGVMTKTEEERSAFAQAAATLTDPADKDGGALGHTSVREKSASTISFDSAEDMNAAQGVAVERLTQVSTLNSEIVDIISQEADGREDIDKLLTAAIDKAEKNGTITAATAKKLRGQVKDTQSLRTTMTGIVRAQDQVARAVGVEAGSRKKALTLGQRIFKNNKKIAQSTAEMKKQSSDLNDNLRNIGSTMGSIGTGFMNGLKGVTQLAQGLNMLQGAFAQIREEGLSLSSITSVLMGISSFIPALVNGYNMFGQVIGATRNQVALFNAVKKTGMSQDALEIASTYLKKSAVEELTEEEQEALLAEQAAQLASTTGMSQDLAAAVLKKFKAKAVEAGTLATEGETVANSANAASWWATAIAEYAACVPLLIIVAILAVLLIAVLAIIAVLGAANKAQEAANKAIMESAAKTQEAIDANQELANSMETLIDGYERLSEAGEDCSEVIANMKEQLPELIASYKELGKTLGEAGEGIDELADGLENSFALGEVTGDFSAFEEQKNKIDTQITRAEYENAKKGGKAAGNLMARSMEDATGGSLSGGKMTLEVGGSDNVWGSGKNADGTYKEGAEEAQARDILGDALGDEYFKKTNDAGLFTKTGAELTVNYSDPIEFVDYYDKLVQAKQEMEATMSAEDLANSDIYREISDAISAGAEYYEQMVPFAEAQIEAGAKLAEADLAMKQEDIQTMEEYLQYKEDFIAKATETYGLSKEQAEAYLMESEALGELNAQYELANVMAKNFAGVDLTDSTMTGTEAGREAANKYYSAIEQAFGEMNELELKAAITLAENSTTFKEFADNLQLTMLQATQAGLESSAQLASTTLANAAEAGRFDMTALLDDENFKAHLEDLGITAETLLNESYDRQAAIVSEFYTKVDQLAYNSLTSQQEVLYQKTADLQRELSAYYAAMATDAADDITSKQAEYQQLANSLASETDETKINEIKQKMEELAQKFQQEYHFEITTNAQSVGAQIDKMVKQIEDLQKQKIEMAMDWSGVDAIENGMKQTAALTKSLQKETKKVGNSYQMTAAQARKWMELYPELSDLAETTTDGLIEMDADKVDAFLQGKDAETDGAIDSEIQKLEAQKAALQADLELKQKDLEAAKLLAQGKMQVEDVSADYLVDLRSNLVDYYMQSGMDEVTANKAALETMGLNEEEYSKLVAEACDTQVENYENSANDQTQLSGDSLSAIAEHWAGFASYLVDNFWPIVKDVAAAILDPTKSVKDVMVEAWNASAPKKITANSDGASGISASDFSFNSMSEQEKSAVFNSVGQAQLDGIGADISELQKGIASVDGQIDYLTALKNQDMGSYGSTDVDEVAGTGDDGGDKKDLKNLDEELERYHEINEVLDDIANALSEVSDLKDRAYGKKRIALMQNELQLLDEQIRAQDELIKQNQQALKDDKAKLDEFGAQYDDKGRIANYDEMYQKQVAMYNQAVADFNSGKISEEVFEQVEANYENFQTAVENYEESLNSLEENQQKQRENMLAQFDKVMETIEYSVEVKIEVRDLELKHLERTLKKLDDEMYDGAAKVQNLTTQINVNFAKIDTYKKGIKDTLKTVDGMKQEDIDAYMAGDASALDGYELNDSQMSKLKEYTEGITSATEAIEEQREQIEGQTMATFEAWHEKLADVGEEYEKLSSITSNYQNIVDIMGKDALGLDNAALADMEAAQVAAAEGRMKNAKAQLDFTQSSIEEAQKALADAQARNDTDAIKKWTEDLETLNTQLLEDQENFTSSWAEALQAAADAFEAQMNRAFDDLDEKLAGSFGSLAELSKSYEQQQTAANRYLDNGQKLYELSKLNRQIQKDIDNSTNVKGQRELAELQEMINAYQQEGVEMSSADLEALKKRYDLKVAEIALEEAQNAKSQVRLTRNSEGGMSYVYTANETKTDDAAQKYEDELEANRQLAETQSNDLTSQIISNRQAMVDALREIRREDYANTEEYQKALDEVTQFYMAQEAYLVDEKNKVIARSQITYAEDYLAYEGWSGKTVDTAALMNQTLAENYNGMGQNSSGWVTTFGEHMTAMCGEYNAVAETAAQLNTLLGNDTEGVYAQNVLGAAAWVSALGTSTSTASAQYGLVGEAGEKLNEDLGDGKSGSGTYAALLASAATYDEGLRDEMSKAGGQYKQVSDAMDELDKKLGSGTINSEGGYGVLLANADSYKGGLGTILGDVADSFDLVLDGTEEGGGANAMKDALGDKDTEGTLFGDTKKAADDWEGAIQTIMANAGVDISNVTGSASSLNGEDGASGQLTTFADHLTEAMYGKGGSKDNPVGGVVGGINDANDRTKQYATDSKTQFAAVTSAVTSWQTVYSPKVTQATDDTNALTGAIAKLAAKQVGVEAIVDGKDDVDNLKNAIDALVDKTITIYTIQKTKYEEEGITSRAGTASTTTTKKATTTTKKATTTTKKATTTTKKATTTTKKATTTTSRPSWDRIMAAYKRINAGAWRTGLANRIADGAKEGFTKPEVEKAQEYINYIYSKDKNGKGYTAESAKKAMGYNTGGYTGEWGPEGRWALLHQKEIVLNAQDTQNMLDMVNIVRDIVAKINIDTLGNLTQAFGRSLFGLPNIGTAVDQNVTITAEFPNATDRNEIAAAFGDIVNLAAQYANRKT